MEKLMCLIIVFTALSGCSSSKSEILIKEAKVYSQTKAVYCGASDVKSYYESDDFISVSCMDGSSKTIFFDE